MDNRWMRAARVGDTEELHQLMQEGMDPGRYVLVDEGMVSPTAEQVTALHLAAFGGHVEACRLLLRAGAEVDSLTLPIEDRGGGDAPLMRAVWGRSIPVALLLLEAGADVIIAIGTQPNPLIRSTTQGLDADRHGCLITRNEDGLTSREMVYAGGDAVTGAATVILAMGAGKRAAAAIDRVIRTGSQENREGGGA